MQVSFQLLFTISRRSKIVTRLLPRRDCQILRPIVIVELLKNRNELITLAIHCLQVALIVKPMRFLLMRQHLLLLVLCVNLHLVIGNPDIVGVMVLAWIILLLLEVGVFIVTAFVLVLEGVNVLYLIVLVVVHLHLFICICELLLLLLFIMHSRYIIIELSLEVFVAAFFVQFLLLLHNKVVVHCSRRAVELALV